MEHTHYGAHTFMEHTISSITPFSMSRLIPSSILGRVAATFGLIVGFCILSPFAQLAYRIVFPQSAFERITGRSLPSGVTVTQYRANITDNFFHVTHYWLLSGDASSLRRVTKDTGFTLSDDAVHMLPDLQDLFGLPLTRADVVAGYEWELDRDRWFYIFRGEQTALYEH